jgi:hypothetical protein
MTSNERWEQFIEKDRLDGSKCYNPTAKMADAIYANVRWTREPTDERIRQINLFYSRVADNDPTYRKLREGMSRCNGESGSGKYRALFSAMRRIENRTMGQTEYENLTAQSLDEIKPISKQQLEAELL